MRGIPKPHGQAVQVISHVARQAVSVPTCDSYHLPPHGSNCAYLPQFHPIPENDEWWGKGFTEWTNVARARPMFRGHVQPRLPGELGFYDLRVEEVREAQADLARRHGITGFCYWHYWFAGRRLLERPFDEVVGSGNPNFPFCLSWANQSWSGVWHGAPDRVLIEQTYPGEKDDLEHFSNLRRAFEDPRYIRVAGRPILCIYQPGQLPNAAQFVERWQKMAHDAGLGGLYLVAGLGESDYNSHVKDGFDAAAYYKLPFVRDGWFRLRTRLHAAESRDIRDGFPMPTCSLSCLETFRVVCFPVSIRIGTTRRASADKVWLSPDHPPNDLARTFGAVSKSPLPVRSMSRSCS